MKLQSQVSREYKGQKYEKYWVVLPSRVVTRLKWKSGDVLTGEIKLNKLEIQKVPVQT